MQDSLIGKQIGKYVITELLGKGGMGHIYKARHPALERDVAIKLLHILKANDPEVVDRFRREAQVVASLRHPGIVQVHDFDVDTSQDLLYMVMEFVQGENLAHRLTSIEAQGGKMPLDEALRLFHLITEAVAYAHQRGVIHCDLKPENVMLSISGRPILTDFGIAKFVHGERVTSSDAILGTPYYMSPEQGTGRWKIDNRTDIYALGIMLYELTTGILPFTGDTYMSIVFKHLTDEAAPPRTLNPDLPEAVEQIIQKAMAKDPDWRYASAQELLADLEAVKPPADLGSASEPGCIFICYNHQNQPDQSLASSLYATLTEQGHQVFVDPITRTDAAGLKQIERQIKASNLFIILLSKAALESEIIHSEINRAQVNYQVRHQPRILAVRLVNGGLPSNTLPASLEALPSIEWHNEADHPRLIEAIHGALAGQAPHQKITSQTGQKITTGIISEDGRFVTRDEIPLAPLPAYNPRSLMELAVPGGAVKLRDKLYLERAADAHLKEQMLAWGSTTTIRAPRQTGKTSLLMRGIHYAREQRRPVVFLDFQSFGTNQLTSPDLFLQEIARSICDELDLEEETVQEAWEGSRSPTKKLTRFMEQYVLSSFDEPIVLAMDEADGLLQTDFYKDFFGLLRSWHNRRASHEEWEKLNMVLVISTEPYLLIDDIHQSPFNVGLHLNLTDFDAVQVAELNRRHNSPVAEAHVPELIALLNGHPFLTRLALYKMVTETIAWTDLRQHAPTDNGPFGDHLRHQYWTIYDKPDLKNALREVILNQCCPDELSLLRLLRSGLIKGSGESYTCRCDLYKLYFEDKLL